MSSQLLSPSLTSLIQRYNLDISIVEIKDLWLGNRVDSEHYLKEHIDIISKIWWVKLWKFEEKIIHPTEITREYTDKGVTFMRTQNLRPFFLDFSNEVFISDEQSMGMNKSKLKYGDILMTRTWANFWDTWIFQQERTNIVASSHVLILRLKEIDPFFVTVYLNTSHGRKLINRWRYWAVQPEIAPSYLREIPIPLPPAPFQSSIASLVQEAHIQRELSESLYAEAENILLKELELINWTPANVSMTKKMSEEVRLFGRCDAEFFQPKYDELIEKIQSYKWWYDTLENLISIVSKQMKPDEEREYQYCELADIDPSLGTVGEYTKIIWKDLPSRARMKIEKWDVVVSSVAGSSSKVALIESEDINLIASTGFFVLKPKAFNAETNLVLMKSIFMQLFLERSARGMILSATNQDDFRNLPIPNISPDIQSLISSRIIASHSARGNSKTLLERSKRAVEIFIEEDEESAERFSKKQM